MKKSPSPVIRQTRQRAAVIRTLREAGRPLSPQELHEGANAACPGLGLRTVYRHIQELSAAGKLMGIDYPGQPLRYELVSGEHHAHFICRHCQRVYDLPVSVPDFPIEDPPGFKITGQETIFYGACPTCEASEAATQA